jgi:hypothetical protein
MGVNEGVNIPLRGHISPLGDNFTPSGEVDPWGPGVKLRMALCNLQKNARSVQSPIGRKLQLFLLFSVLPSIYIETI